MQAALARVAPRLTVSTVIDVGASDGRWSVSAARQFRSARFLLIEALEVPHGEALRRLPGDRFQVVIAAAGDTVGDVHFDAGDEFGGAAHREGTGSHDILVPMTTIDAEVAARGLPGPYLLKLDTHGFEVPILTGAERTLADTTVIVVEAYNFPIHPEALMFAELCAYLGQRGFRVFDLVDAMRRPQDEALWQFDLVFLRADRPEFSSDRYA